MSPPSLGHLALAQYNASGGSSESHPPSQKLLQSECQSGHAYSGSPEDPWGTITPAPLAKYNTELVDDDEIGPIPNEYKVSDIFTSSVDSIPLTTEKTWILNSKISLKSVNLYENDIFPVSSVPKSLIVSDGVKFSGLISVVPIAGNNLNLNLLPGETFWVTKETLNSQCWPNKTCLFTDSSYAGGCVSSIIGIVTSSNTIPS